MNIAVQPPDLSLDKVRNLSRKAGPSAKNPELMTACEGFEALFLNTLMTSMRQSLPGDALFPDSHAVDIYRSLQDQYLSEHLASGHHTMGIKEMLYRSLQQDTP